MSVDPNATVDPESSWQPDSSPGPPPTRREDVTGLSDGPPPTRRETPEEGTGGPTGARDADEHGDALVLLPEPLREDWQIVRELPGGGEADVLLIRDATGRERVVKIYRRHITLDAEVMRRLVGLDRTRLLAPERTGFDHGRHWELMEYVPGGSLAEYLDRVGTALDGAEIVEVIRQITDALAELHQARLTHSDLKPSNVLLRHSSPISLVLSDFGLSKYLGDASKRFTQQGHTIAYAAPESFAGRFSPAQDWWALGMIVRQLATGEAPFAGLSERVALHELLVRDVPLDAVSDDRLRLLCRGLLVRDPDHRWAEEQVRSWLAGGTPEVYRAASGVRGGRPLVVAGQTCWTRAEAARAFATHWDRARETFLERIGTARDPGEGWRLLRTWMEQFDEDVEERIRLIDQVLTSDIPPDVRMVHLLRWLDPSMPPTYRNRSLLPEHIANLVAEENGGTGPGIVSDLWRHRLLGLLAEFAGGAELANVDLRWRDSAQRLDAIRAAATLPGPARDALARTGADHLSTLLHAAADPELPPLLAQQAAQARAAIPERPPWFDALDDVRDPAVALAVITVAPIAQAEYAQVLAERNRGRLMWEQEERDRIAGRQQALGFATAAVAIWTGVMVIGTIAAIISVALFEDSSDPSTNPLVPVGVYGVAWLLSAVAELVLAYHVGVDYHPRWSALTRLRWLVRRVPDAWDSIRSVSNSVRAYTPPLLLGLACCVGCCLLGPILSLGSLLVATLTLGASVGQLGWALVRAVQFNREREQRRRTLLGETASQTTSPVGFGRSHPKGG